ncbi:MAG: glycoside hydrolase family 97 protein [Saprospiraceae bacterium]
MIKKLLLSYLCFGMIPTMYGQDNYEFQSPGGEVSFSINCQLQHPQYTVKYREDILIDESELGLFFTLQDSFYSNISIGNSTSKLDTLTYLLPAGKASFIKEVYRQAYIPLIEKKGKKRLVLLDVMLFNDGIAFRYEIPSTKSWKNYSLTDEHTQFRVVGNPIARVAFLENFTTSHEHRYEKLPVNKIKNDVLIDLPALFEYPGKAYLAITEANLINYAGMSLSKRNNVLTSCLSHLPKHPDTKVIASLPHQTPWRVMLISERIGALIESNILTNVCEPSKIKDISWLRPGKASFHWWNGDIMPDTTFEPGVNFNFNKYYIDFCARNKIEYHTVIGYRGVAWYQNDGIEYQPGPNTDVTKPRPGLDMKEICDYAASVHVGIRVWVHWKALYPQLEAAFTQFEKWGIKGMMVDFMDRDDQEMVNIQEKILKRAAAHHLEIQFHGVFKPTGLSRTYPNESTREGTLNYECNKWGNLITPNDDINIPFTRLLAGPTDYHLGGFRAMPANKFDTLFTRPHMLGTRSHMLAMYVVLENHLSMVCDYPQAYEGQPGFEFIQEVPTVWDQTSVPQAELEKWVCIARKKGSDWYLGIITNNDGRDVRIPLNFLPAGNFKATIFRDNESTLLDPNQLTKEIITINSTEELNLHLAPGGGSVIKISIN